MAYFKVVIKEEFVYEVLLKAHSIDEAKKQVLLEYSCDWGDPVQTSNHVYDAVELTEKPV
jgi:hypothetical protein